MKANHPLEFWKATLNNCQSSYKKWVHYYEAKIAGIDYSKELLKKDDISIYALNRKKKIEDLTPRQQLQKYGYWIIIKEDFFPGCYLKINKDEYSFNGIIASYRIKSNNKNKKTIMIYIGVDKNKYIQVNIENINCFNVKNIGIEGIGKPLTDSDKLCSIVTTTKYKFY
jgi:hypothetical protein